MSRAASFPEPASYVDQVVPVAGGEHAGQVDDVAARRAQRVLYGLVVLVETGPDDLGRAALRVRPRVVQRGPAA